MDYTQHLTATQQEQARADQVKNSAGGFSFKVTPEQQFLRFLILGTEGGSYYASERKLTRDNVAGLDALMNSGRGLAAVQQIIEVSETGRAPKNDPALFALAYLAVGGDETTKQAAYDAVVKVARTGTHLFQWVAMYKSINGSVGSSGFKRAVARWYTLKTPEQLALQVTKYRQREDWTHRDLLRVVHATPPNDAAQAVLQFVAQPEKFAAAAKTYKYDAMRLINAYNRLREGNPRKSTVVKMITDQKVPRELLPTEWLREPEVWEALLQDMPVTATIRNLGKMTSIGLIQPLSDAAKLVTDRLGNAQQIQKSRVHPIQVLTAKITYANGRGDKGSLSWTPVSQVTDALEGAFYTAFGNVRPSGKRMLLALDVSGSMTWGTVAGVNGLTPNMAAAAMAMVTARTESQYYVFGFADRFRDLGVTARDTLESAMRKTNNMSFGSTDCALPMLWAEQNKIDVDGFIVYTDSETWFGRVHPYQALKNYRRARVKDARSVVVGMVSTRFTIADPKDAGMLDVVGFDTASPQVIADFVKGVV